MTSKLRKRLQGRFEEHAIASMLDEGELEQHLVNVSTTGLEQETRAFSQTHGIPYGRKKGPGE